MKKILFIHNEYGEFSGEEFACYSQFDIIKKHFIASSFFVGKARTPTSFLEKIHAFFSGIFSIKSFFIVYFKVKKNNIDIVHFHNIYPWLSISSVIAAKLSGANVVFTLHNFKHICPSATLSHNGGLYNKALKFGAFNTVIDNIQGDFFKSLGYYLRFKSERVFKLDAIVDRFIFVSELQKGLFTDKGGFYNKSCVIPNFIPDNIATKINSVRCKYDNDGYSVAYIGRTSQEKGFLRFVSIAEASPDIKFIVFGDVIDEGVILPSNCKVEGRLPHDKLLLKLSGCDCVLIPSITYETFSLAALEALCLGLKVIVADTVGISEHKNKFRNLFVAKNDEEIINLISEPYVKMTHSLPFEFTQRGFLYKITEVYNGL